MKLAIKTLRDRRHAVTNSFSLVLVALALAFLAGPLCWQISTSLRPEGDRMPAVWPSRWSLVNYASALGGRPLARALLNSALVAAATTVSALGLGALAAFAIANLPLRGKNVMIGIALAISMFPPISTVSPLYISFRWLGMRDTLTALVITQTTFALPLAFVVLTGAFRAIPAALYDSARIDGCTPWQAFRRIFLPLATPSVAATALIVFVFSYNEFLYALTFTSSADKQTLPVAISLFASDRREPWGEMAAATVISALPLVALALAFQRKIVPALTQGAVKD